MQKIITKLVRAVINLTKRIYLWYKEHLATILLIALLQSVYFLVHYVPYLNWFIELIGMLVLIADLVIFVIFFHLSAKGTIIFAITLYSLSFVFSIISKAIAEGFGDLTYILLLLGLVKLVKKEIPKLTNGFNQSRVIHSKLKSHLSKDKQMTKKHGQTRGK